MDNIKSKISLILLVVFLLTLTLNVFAKDHKEGSQCILMIEPLGECKEHDNNGYYCDFELVDWYECDGDTDV